MISKTITSKYTGKKKYFTMHLTTQYRTSVGPGTVFCTAGGTTLGK
ncbi:hypothetical protein LFYK43_00890 [Ligilactobacillus salitolerans]|uniref:Uncharacterized protein n=1 Tax=Ligilactobacillus salitolerans TaxID=1808352 RepID=A0A401IQ45_9LACO|nr:hypothetical protein LFYK43_00890 [Ligilactobacillus salitolerans]